MLSVLPASCSPVSAVVFMADLVGVAGPAVTGEFCWPGLTTRSCSGFVCAGVPAVLTADLDGVTESLLGVDTDCLEEEEKAAGW